MAFVLVLALAPAMAFAPAPAQALLSPSGRLGAGLPTAGPALSVSLSADPAQGAAPLLVSFTATVTGALSPPTLNYSWDFGDGSAYTAQGIASISHTYQQARTTPYVANVTVHDASAHANRSISVLVETSALVVAISASPLAGPAPLTVSFVAQVSGGSGTYPSLLWDFGDGKVGSGSSVRETFTGTGTYRANLTVTDSLGATGVAAVWINATPAPQNVTSTGASPWVPLLLAWLPWAVAIVAVALAAAIVYLTSPRRAGGGGTEGGRGEERGEGGAPGPGEGAPGSPGPATEVVRSDTAQGTRSGTEEGRGRGEPSAVPTPPPASEAVSRPPLPAIAPGSFVPSLPQREEARPAPVAIQGPSEPPGPGELGTQGPEGRATTPSAAPTSASPPDPTGASARPLDASPSATTVVATPAVPAETLRLSFRIVLHLASQGALGVHDVAPPGFTQAGMASALGTRQNNVATILKRLEVAGVVVSDVRHVQGAARRMKVYRLTPRGEALAREVRGRRAERGAAPTRAGPRRGEVEAALPPPREGEP